MSPILGARGGLSASAYGFTSAVPALGDYQSIQTVTVGSTSQSSIAFTSIPGTYKHLQIRYISRCSRSSASDGLSFRFNGDTSTNYARHILYADGTVGAEGSTSQTLTNCAVEAAANSGTNIFGAGIVDILDYTSTNKCKTVRALAGVDGNTAFGDLRVGGGLWFKTPEAITSITVLAESGAANFVQYTSFALYGVK
jgi:hypothetical protein